MSPEDLAHIKAAFMEMPYLPNATWVPVDRLSTAEDVADMLKALAEHLRIHAKEVDDLEKELRVLQSQRRAIRSFLGIEGES